MFSKQNGDLCISILHPPVDDPQSGEMPCERWNPTQNVRCVDFVSTVDWSALTCAGPSTNPTFCSGYLGFRTILLSVISLLNEPNTSSPANVDASVMYRRWKDSRGADNEYENIIRYVDRSSCL